MNFKQTLQTAIETVSNFSFPYEGNMMMIKTNKKCDLSKQFNNVIIDKKTYDVVHYTGKTITEVFSIPDGIGENTIETILSVPEGTVIRVFYYNNKWRYATNRKLNAYKTFFQSSKSFGKMFDEALLCSDIKLQSLDKKYCYCFILIHKENRIVLPIEKTYTKILSKTNLDTLEVSYNVDFIIDKYDETNDITIFKTKCGDMYKLCSKKYKYYETLRNPSERDIYKRYSQLTSPEDVDNFKKYFSDMFTRKPILKSLYIDTKVMNNLVLENIEISFDENGIIASNLVPIEPYEPYKRLGDYMPDKNMCNSLFGDVISTNSMNTTTTSSWADDE